LIEERLNVLLGFSLRPRDASYVTIVPGLREGPKIDVAMTTGEASDGFFRDEASLGLTV